MHTPIGDCTSDCRRDGCPEVATNEEKIIEWLARNEYSLSDVLQDDEGRPYVNSYHEYESGEDGMSGGMRKLYLPKEVLET